MEERGPEETLEAWLEASCMSDTFLGFSTTGTTAAVRATLYILEIVLCGHHGDCITAVAAYVIWMPLITF